MNAKARIAAAVAVVACVLIASGALQLAGKLS